MPAKLITFTATSPNSANYCWRYLTSDVLHGPAVTTIFVCSEPEDGLAPKLAPGYSGFLDDFEMLAVTLLHLTHKILAVISSVSSEGNIGILLWTPGLT